MPSNWKIFVRGNSYTAQKISTTAVANTCTCTAASDLTALLMPLNAGLNAISLFKTNKCSFRVFSKGFIDNKKEAGKTQSN